MRVAIMNQTGHKTGGMYCGKKGNTIRSRMTGNAKTILTMPEKDPFCKKGKINNKCRGLAIRCASWDQLRSAK